MGKNFKWRVLLILAVLVGSIWSLYPPTNTDWSKFPATDKVTLGLDLQGGMHIVLKVDLDQMDEEMFSDPEARRDAVDRVHEVLINRIDEFGVREPSITRQGTDHIVVQLPGVTDRQRAKDILQRTAHLEFKLVADDSDITNEALKGNVAEGYEVANMEYRGIAEQLVLEKHVVMTGDKLVDAKVDFSQMGQPVVSFTLNSEGAKTFAQVTRENVGRQLAIVLDGNVQTAPRIQTPIPDGRGQITGNFTFEQASDTALVLRAGALPVPVTVEEERVVGPALGRDSIVQGTRAILIGGAAVFLFMLAYYLLCGVVANLALLLNFLIIFAVLPMIDASLTLPGLAGIVLTLGMAVDANVLIYERMREEMGLGKSVRAVISGAYHKAFVPILDSNLTTILAAAILFYFGTGPIKGFAVTITIGLVASLFCSLFVTRTIFTFLTRNGREIKLKMLSIIGETKINFVKGRYIAYVLSIVLISVGMFAFFNRGQLNYGVDFAGGTLQQVAFTQKPDVAQVRTKLTELGVTANIQSFRELEHEEMIFRTVEDETANIAKVLNETVGEGNYDVVRVETVGPTVGRMLREKALYAIIFSVIGICVYVGFRFKSIKFSIAAIVSLAHDVLVAIGIFAICQREFNLPIVAALLTLAGYSINDTIITFDRIRDNLKNLRRESLSSVINLSINQMLSRTILTSGTTLFVVLALFFLGGRVINDFALILLIGIITGVYSSIYVAAPLLVEMNRDKTK